MLLLHHLWLSKAANSQLLLSPGKEETSESSAQYVLIAEALFAKEVPKHMFVTFFFLNHTTLLSMVGKFYFCKNNTY